MKTRRSKAKTQASMAGDTVSIATERLLARLPEIVDHVVSEVLDGNDAACKLVLDIAGLKEETRIALENARQAQSDNASPLELDIFEEICRKIDAMPDPRSLVGNR